MRGFLLTAVVLVGLDVLLHSPTSNVATAFEVPTRWLAEWMDPRTPLIAAGPAQPAAKNAAAPGGGGINVLGGIGNFFRGLLP